MELHKRNLLTPMGLRDCDKKVLQDILRPAGMHDRMAGHLKEAGRIIVEEFDGRIPDTIETIRKISGVGDKAAKVSKTVRRLLVGNTTLP